MKKRMMTLFICLWLAALAALGTYYLAFAPREEAYSETENRLLAGFPATSAQALLSGDFGESFETYLLDRFPARSGVIDAVNLLRGKLSFATHEEYLLIAEEPEDLLVGDDFMDDLSALLEAPVSTPKPTATPAPTPDSTPEPHEITPTPAPTEYPPIEPKPAFDTANLPNKYYVYIDSGDGPFSVAPYFSLQVKGMANLLSIYAGLLPEDGKLMFTVVPSAKSGNRFVNAKNRVAFYSDWDEAVTGMTSDNVYAFDTAEILSEAIKNGEYVYFRQDMHWTPYGSYLVYCEMAKRAGKTPASYTDDFDLTVEEPFRGTYYRDNPSAYTKVEPDRLDLLMPKFPFEWRRVTAPDQYEVIPFLDFDANPRDRYTVYLGGPAGPWTYTESDNGETENCLVITDSFGLGFIPFVTTDYRQVHYYDPRYFKPNVVGGTVAELIEKFEIQDIYIVIGDLHSFNSEFLIRDGKRQLGV